MRSESDGPFALLWTDEGSVSPSIPAPSTAGDLGDAPVRADAEVLSIEELAKRFNVSTKTISRWRAHGLEIGRAHV